MFYLKFPFDSSFMTPNTFSVYNIIDIEYTHLVLLIYADILYSYY